MALTIQILKTDQQRKEKEKSLAILRKQTTNKKY